MDRTTERVAREREILANLESRREREAREQASRDPERALLANGKPNHYYDIEREQYTGSMQGIETANRDAGFHWFDADTLRFFGSRISEASFDGRYFVTSEDNFDRSARSYSIREAMSDGRVATVGDFQEFATRAQAIAAIDRLKREGEG